MVQNFCEGGRPIQLELYGFSWTPKPMRICSEGNPNNGAYSQVNTDRTADSVTIWPQLSTGALCFHTTDSIIYYLFIFIPLLFYHEAPSDAHGIFWEYPIQGLRDAPVWKCIPSTTRAHAPSCLTGILLSSQQTPLCALRNGVSMRRLILQPNETGSK